MPRIFSLATRQFSGMSTDFHSGSISAIRVIGGLS